MMTPPDDPLRADHDYEAVARSGTLGKYLRAEQLAEIADRDGRYKARIADLEAQLALQQPARSEGPCRCPNHTDMLYEPVHCPLPMDGPDNKCRVCRDHDVAALQQPARSEGLDEAYRERAALVAALIRVGGYAAEVVMAPDTEGWFIVYAETPAGQVSWHVSPDDMDLFSDWPVAFGTRPSPWDGHTTDEKYRRVAALHPSIPGETERA